MLLQDGVGGGVLAEEEVGDLGFDVVGAGAQAGVGGVVVAHLVADAGQVVAVGAVEVADVVEVDGGGHVVSPGVAWTRCGC